MRSVSKRFESMRRQVDSAGRWRQFVEVEGGWRSGFTDTRPLASTVFGTKAAFRNMSGIELESRSSARSWLSATSWQSIRPVGRLSPESAPRRSISSSSDGASVGFPPSRPSRRSCPGPAKRKRSRPTPCRRPPLSSLQSSQDGRSSANRPGRASIPAGASGGYPLLLLPHHQCRRTNSLGQPVPR